MDALRSTLFVWARVLTLTSLERTYNISSEEKKSKEDYSHNCTLPSPLSNKKNSD